MPELPEVETIRRQLEPLFQGEGIKDVTIHTPYLIKNTSPEVFRKALSGKKIDKFSRIAKFLVFECSGVYPVFHLGMSGIFLTDKSESKYPQHIHVELHFGSGKNLYFQDMRKFGKVWLFDKYPNFPTIGHDPTIKTLTIDILKGMLQKRKLNMKAFLMDQSIIAGIGNIYASEILFQSGISPLRKAGDLTDAEIKRLHQSVHNILNAAIDNFGTTYSAYQTVTGKPGENQNFLKVYQRSGESCFNCDGQIKKIVLGSRSTFFCENCQK